MKNSMNTNIFKKSFWNLLDLLIRIFPIWITIYYKAIIQIASWFKLPQ